MHSSDKQLGAQLYGLYIAGTKYMPAVAAQFTTAQENLRDAAGSDGAWARPGVLGGGRGPAYPRVAELREQLIATTSQMSSSLTAVAEALVLAAKEYQKTDQAAREQFTAMLNGAGHGEY